MVKIRENPIKMDDLGYPTPIFGSTPGWRFCWLFSALKNRGKMPLQVGSILVEALGLDGCHSLAMVDKHCHL